MYTNVPKPTTPTYTKIPVAGKTTYDLSTISYNEPTINYDGLGLSYTNVDIIPITIFDSYPTSKVTNNFGIGTPAIQVGQSFTALGGYLKTAQFYLANTNGGGGTAVARLYSHVGTFGNALPGSILATSDPVDASTFSISNTLITFNFENYLLTSGTHYFIVFYLPSPAPSVFWGYGTSSLVGNAVFTGFSGFQVSPGKEFSFSINGQLFNYTKVPKPV